MARILEGCSVPARGGEKGVIAGGGQSRRAARAAKKTESRGNTPDFPFIIYWN